MNERRSLFFVGPRAVEVRTERLPAPGPGELLIRTTRTAISAGTELLIYKDQFPPDMDLDSTLPGLQGPPRHPLKYGYCAVGRVAECGSAGLESWVGRRVFSFHAHESAFLAGPADLHGIPDDVTDESAALLPSMETAVGLVMDSRPMLGEQVAVLGQGVVGLLCTALLAHHPLSSLVTSDRYDLRRSASVDLGATVSLDPTDPDAAERLRAALKRGRGAEGADLCLELTGAPEVLNRAVEITGFDGRIAIGSWYGTRAAPIALGGVFHRSRIRLISSQVSTLAPRLTGRWDKASRLAVVWVWLRRIDPGKLVTHRFPLERANEAYRMLADEPGRVLQSLLTY